MKEKNGFEIIIGKKITHVCMDDGPSDILLKTDDGECFYGEVVRQCCEHICILSISSINNLIGEKVLSVESKELETTEEDEDTIQTHVYTFKTDKGDFIFEITKIHYEPRIGIKFKVRCLEEVREDFEL